METLKQIEEPLIPRYFASSRTRKSRKSRFRSRSFSAPITRSGGSYRSRSRSRDREKEEGAIDYDVSGRRRWRRIVTPEWEHAEREWDSVQSSPRNIEWNEDELRSLVLDEGGGGEGEGEGDSPDVFDLIDESDTEDEVNSDLEEEKAFEPREEEESSPSSSDESEDF